MTGSDYGLLPVRHKALTGVNVAQDDWRRVTSQRQSEYYTIPSPMNIQ